MRSSVIMKSSATDIQSIDDSMNTKAILIGKLIDLDK